MRRPVPTSTFPRIDRGRAVGVDGDEAVHLAGIQGLAGGRRLCAERLGAKAGERERDHESATGLEQVAA